MMKIGSRSYLQADPSRMTGLFDCTVELGLGLADGDFQKRILTVRLFGMTCNGITFSGILQLEAEYVANFTAAFSLAGLSLFRHLRLLLYNGTCLPLGFPGALRLLWYRW